MNATPNFKDLQFSFDVGHDSIGWAVLQTRTGEIGGSLLGTGVVTFEADDCLASKRRMYRRQRRHVRSTRQRVARMEKLLAHLGAVSAGDLKAKHRPAGGDSAPWLLAARVLAEGRTLSWVQLWDVLRWYAHNRGYDGNRRWSSDAVDGTDEAALSDEEKAERKADSEKEANARTLMHEFGTKTMAETFVRVLGLAANGSQKASRVRFKAKNAAFPRDGVEREVTRILEAHRGRLPKLDEALIRLLMARKLTQAERERLAAAGIVLPARFEGGLLFGQLVPHFDNRIISTCPISGEKVPSKNCPEFFRFRWAMQLANIRVASAAEKELRPLFVGERQKIDGMMRAEGRLTKTELKKAVRGLPGIERDNLDNLLMHPDAEESLELDAITHLTRTGYLEKLWPALSPRVQKRARDAWRRGRTLAIGELRMFAEKLGEPVAPFDKALGLILDASNTRKRKKDTALTRETVLAAKVAPGKISGRAAYARPLLVKAAEEVMQGRHPKEEGGCLYLSEEVRRAQINRRVEDQINNHLVRHRLLILERLLNDIVADPQFAAGDKNRVGRLTIEVNRDLREMSGKTAKQIEQDLGLRLSNHDKVSKKLEEVFAGQTFNGKPVTITAGLIRKARIADDLGWECPYTGAKFEPIDLVTRRVDKDHIIPRSLRPSDSLDSLVVTFSEINKWKGARTAWKFIGQEESKPVPGMPNLSIRPLREYEEWVKSLESFRGHNDDKRRKKNRKALLLLPEYEEKQKDFLPGDLTATSQLVRLGAQLLTKNFADLPKPPPVISIPGAVTAEVRKSWKLTACLSLAAPDVLDADGSPKVKRDIRGITHLHHALDACALAYASALLPRDGGLWEAMIKRNKSDADKALLRATGCFDFNHEGRFELHDLPAELKEQIRQRLAEKRVVQHVPADMGGFPADATYYRLHEEWQKDGKTRVTKKVRKSGLPTKQKPKKLYKTDTSDKKFYYVYDDINDGKLIGLHPIGDVKNSKLAALKAALIIDANFGLAILDHIAEGEEKFAIIPWHKVWFRLGELTKRNAGKPPRLLRNGMLIHIPRGGYAGIWKIFSVKNNATGMALDIGWPDVIRLKNKTPGHKIGAKLKTLLRDGLEILDRKLTGLSIEKGL